MTRNNQPATSSFTNALTSQQCAAVSSSVTEAIYRLATQGSRTRKGGVIRQASAPLTITLDDGQVVRVAQTGDYAEYPDGSRAHIISGAGAQGQLQDQAIALVGSALSNGDEIIDTPQNTVLISKQQGVPMADDFLTSAR